MTEAGSENRGREQYSLGNAAEVGRGMAARTADNSAAFFVRHLRPGMRLLDCGCGAGSITLGLAEVVAPAEVVGIDIDAGQVQAATALAAEKGLLNLSFRTGDAYELPFPNASFDAVFANALLIHLRKPLDAILEMKRVLKPGGLIGIRDADRGFDLRAPETPLLKEMFALWVRVLERNGGSPYYARNLRDLLIQAGFDKTEASAFALTYGTFEATRRNATGTQNVFRALARTAIAEGWTDEAKVDALCDEIVAWGEKEGAFGLTLWFSAVGWLQ